MCVINGFLVALVVALLASAVSVVNSQSSSSSSLLLRASFDPIEEEKENILNQLLKPVKVKDVDNRERSLIINGNDAERYEYPWFGKYLLWYMITLLPSFFIFYFPIPFPGCVLTGIRGHIELIFVRD